jgi:exopolyphosphatase/pppGpp-phosphohydrolase
MQELAQSHFASMLWLGRKTNGEKAVYTTGSMFRAVGRIAYERLIRINYNAKFAHGITFSADKIQDFLNSLMMLGRVEIEDQFTSKLNQKDRCAWEKHIGNRLGNIPMGACILESFLKAANATHVVFSGVRTADGVDALQRRGANMSQVVSYRCG